MESSCSNTHSEISADKMEYFHVLKRAVSPQGPNALPAKTTFGSTAKLESLSNKDRKVDYMSMTRDVETWRIHNELGQTLPRKKLAATYGKLLENPGSADYSPNPTVLSTDESGPHFSLHSRTFVEIVDKMETPGPGTYELPSCIKPALPIPGDRRKIKTISSSKAVLKGNQ